MKQHLIAALTFLLFGAMAEAASEKTELSFLDQMEGLIADCRITSTSTYDEAFLVGRKNGRAGPEYDKALMTAGSATQACVNKNKPKGRDFYKAELSKLPELKPALAKYYGSWLGYMDWFSYPHDGLEESSEKTSYESNLNQLIAELDAL